MTIYYVILYEDSYILNLFDNSRSSGLFDFVK
jgi:hypothetical protein